MFRVWLVVTAFTFPVQAGEVRITDSPQAVQIETAELSAAINKRGYVTGVQAQSFVDKKSGFRDLGFGLDVVDWIMEPGSDEIDRDKLDPKLIYHFGNRHHGDRPKRSIEGPQICTQAGSLVPVIVRGKDFVAIRQEYRFQIAAPNRQSGSLWTQWIVFPDGKRYFISMDRIDAVNSSEAMFLRIDMPGHIRHDLENCFDQVYLSYEGVVPADTFAEEFAPDIKFNYRRDQNPVPERFIRAYRLKNNRTGETGPWLAGMTLDPEIVYEAWCHERGYVCMIQEIGGRPIAAGGSISAAFVVGYFDSIDEMHRVYDEYRGHTGLTVTLDGWKLTP